ncbi:MAG: alpha-ketoglutarate-dependent dioxygenase AlkB [Sandaracinaceae bacterium]
MPREPFADGGWVEFDAAFVEDHARAMTALLSSLPLRQETIRMFGKEHLTPRRTSWHGDPGCHYRYSGRRFEPSPWTAELDMLRDALTARAGLRFNSVLVNHYRDGHDAMGEHADDEPELGPHADDVRIASVSLGAARRFVLKHRKSKEKREWSLGGGSLLLMGGTLQRHWVHRVPRTKRPVGPRLNLTFRYIRP